MDNLLRYNHDDVAIYLVHGFIHEYEQLFSLKKFIPAEIIEICLCFYCDDIEHFVYNGSVISLNNNNKIANCLKSWDDYEQLTVYGDININNKINSNYLIYKWKLKIIQKQIGSPIGIGIDSSNKTHFNDDFSNPFINYDQFYCFMNNGYTACSQNILLQPWCESFTHKTNNIIEMEINTKHKTISYAVNDENLSTAFKNIMFSNDIKYNMAIMTDYCQIQIELLSFERRFIFD